jgi:hypothetical protein
MLCCAAISQTATTCASWPTCRDVAGYQNTHGRVGHLRADTASQTVPVAESPVARTAKSSCPSHLSCQACLLSHIVCCQRIMKPRLLKLYAQPGLQEPLRVPLPVRRRAFGFIRNRAGVG